MALSYKLLKTVEVDGVKMGLDSELGKRTVNGKYETLSANSQKNGAEITISDAGLYLLRAGWGFQPTSTSNARMGVCIGYKMNGQSAYSYLDWMQQFSQMNTNINSIRIVRFSESEVPASLVVSGFSAVACSSSYTVIEAVKLIDIVGG